MGQVIVTIVFTIVSYISSFILAPFINAVFLLFPQLNDYVTYYVGFMNYGFTYITCICRLILLDSTVLTTIFSFLVIKYAIYVLVSAIRFAFRGYNYLKP